MHMNINLKIWRQAHAQTPGCFESYRLEAISPHLSFLEMLDVLNEQLLQHHQETIVFDHDCREGICGMCSLMINGRAHGPEQGVTTCQIHMRAFETESTLYIEPWRAQALPVIQDLMVDRSALDRIIAAGGYIAVNCGSAPEANTFPIPKTTAETAFAAASCIGCGACIASCNNASAMLFIAAKVSHLALLPQGQAERSIRVTQMVAQMDKEGFGACSHTGACAVECPKNIDLTHIARLNREYLNAQGFRYD